MPDPHTLRRAAGRVAVVGAALAMAFALSAAGCSTTGRELPAPTTTSPLAATVLAPATTR